jgi:ribose 1,5-bisphosphate isomerase
MDLVRELRDDRRSGARELSIKSLEAFMRLARETNAESVEAQEKMLKDIALRIISAQPSMASVFNCMNNLFPLKGKNAEQLRNRAIQKAKNEIASIRRIDSRISRIGAQLIKRGEVILTLSSSSSVFHLLERALHKEIRIIVCESHPGGEGVTFAEMISSLAVTTLIPDFTFPHFMDEVTLVLVGADAVSPTHIINKCGTSLIARESRRRKIPTVCVCDTYKIIPFNLPIEEFLRIEGGLTRREVLFDRTPLKAVTHFLTEGGIHDYDTMKRIGNQKKNQFTVL